MKIFDDFLNWDGNGIYEWDQKSDLSSINGHAVVIVGWGNDLFTQKPYWIVRNSWSNLWGDNGYFKILRGVNHCEIEENIFVGFPQLPTIRLYIEHPILFSLDDYNLRSIWNIQDNGYKLSSIKKNKSLYSKTATLYDYKYCPNFEQVLAGDLKSLEYKIFEQYVITPKFNKKNNYSFQTIIKLSFNFVLVFLIITIIIKILRK